MRPIRSAGVIIGLWATVTATPHRRLEPPELQPNPNTARAGTLRDGVLTLALDAIEGRWQPDGGPLARPLIEAFAERGTAAVVPGPLIRVPAGTVVRVSVRNTLARPITFFLPTSPATDDSIIVESGATGQIEVRAATPGNYLYRATGRNTASGQLRIMGAMAGAMVDDSAGIRPPADRVWMILMTPDSALIAAADTENVVTSTAGRFAFTINGRAWPNTERVSTTVGDTLHWRIINASQDVHPMHLHGFYFRVDEFTGRLAGTDGQGDRGRMVVTERMSNFSAM